MPRKLKRTKKTKKAEKKYLTRFTLIKMIDKGMIPEKELSTRDKIERRKRRLRSAVTAASRG